MAPDHTERSLLAPLEAAPTDPPTVPPRVPPTVPPTVSGGPLPLTHWAAARFPNPPKHLDAILQAAAETLVRQAPLGFEFHLDGSSRTDVSVMTNGVPGRHLTAGSAHYLLGEHDIAEYDVINGVPVLAGTFHQVLEATHGESLAWLGRPILASVMTGRGGNLRLIVRIPDQETLATFAAQLPGLGIPPAAAAMLSRAGDLITSPRSLRLGLEYLPAQDRLGPRLGLEVMVDPGQWDVYPTLTALGVASEVQDRLRKAMATIPGSRGLRPAFPWAPIRREHLSATHISLAWTGAAPVAKVYFLAGSAPEPDPDTLADYSSWTQGEPWRSRIEWAGRQLPLLEPTPGEEAGVAGWTAVVDPHGLGLAAARWELDALSPARAQVAVSDRAELQQDAPAWWPWYQRARDILAERATVPGDWLGAMERSLPPDARKIPFAHLFAPLAEAWRELLDPPAGADSGVDPGPRAEPNARAEQARAAARELAAEPAQDLTAEPAQDLQLWLLRRLSETCAPAIAELRTSEWTFGQRLAAAIGEEPTAAPREGYAAFCQHLQADQLRPLQREFPVLPRLIATVVRQWSESVAELLTRLDASRAEIARTLGVPADAPLLGIGTGAGDTHHDGRAVCVLRFAEGTIVYKPRDVGLERLYAEAVTLVNSASTLPPLLAPTALSCEDAEGNRYGYVAFVERRPVAGPAEMEQFYRNAGRNLALLYALGATDCHMENLIASGDQLVLIDTETLLEPVPHANPGAPEESGTPAPANPPAPPSPAPAPSSTLASVLQVGMLPGWIWMEGARACLDISALGVPARPNAVPGRGWRAVNTDLMAPGHVRRTLPHPDCLPTPPGATPDFHAHLPAVLAGFQDGYRSVLTARPELRTLLAQASPARRRLVRRPTYVYASLLLKSLEPDSLRSHQARALTLEKLTRAYLTEEARAQWPAVRAEQAALDRLDVPYFFAPVDRGGVHWEDGFLDDAATTPTPLSAALEHLASLGEEDLAWQSALIQGAYAVRQMTYDRTSSDPRPATAPAGEDRLTVIRRCLTAIIAARRVTSGSSRWMGLRILPEEGKATLVPIGAGLYEGTLGVAIGLLEGARALARAGAEQSDPRSADASNADPRSADASNADPRSANAAREDMALIASARAAAAGALAPLLALPTQPLSAANAVITMEGLGFGGAGGLLRGLSFLRSRRHLTPEEVEPVESALLTALTPARISADRNLDLMAGAAGLIAPLCRLYSERGDPATRALLVAAAERLVAAQDPATGAWHTLPASAPLTGIAHGASGCALALAEAAVTLSDDRLLDAALRGLAYEESVFDAASGNWPDFRSDPASMPAGGSPPSSGKLDATDASAAGGEMAGAGTGEQTGVGALRFGQAWCTGGPGIGLSRMRLKDLLPDHADAQKWAGQEVVGGAVGKRTAILGGDHLCCGNLGLVAILRAQAEREGRPDWAEAAGVTESAVLARLGGGLPRSQLGAVEGGIPMPGLMTGIAGALVVLANPDDSGWVGSLLL